MKYIISQADLADLKAKAQSWLSSNCRNSYYYKTKKTHYCLFKFMYLFLYWRNNFNKTY